MRGDILMKPMRRNKQEICDLDRITQIIHDCDTLHVGFYDGEEVYIVPLSFGYECHDGTFTFYFHSAPEGRKVSLLLSGNPVGFEMDCGHQVKHADTFCDYTMKYQSIIGTAVPREAVGDEKMKGYEILMAHYTDRKLEFDPAIVAKTKIFALDVKEFRCKEHL